MEDLFGSTNPVAFTLKLLKADFHGAIITGNMSAQSALAFSDLSTFHSRSFTHGNLLLV